MAAPRIQGWGAALLLTGCAVVLAWPVLTGGALSYLDNPVHLAEAHDLAHTAGGGWSEAAFCGFPVHQLHSPLWYGALAGLHRVGLPLEPLYAGAVWLGFLAPCLALFWVLRRRVGVVPAAALSFLLLIQRPGLLGLGSALGGMWTFSLATAGLILLLDRLPRPHRTGRDLAWTAALFGLVGLTHLFAVLPAALALALLAVIRRGRDMSRPALAAALGGAASAAYWFPLLWASGGRLVAETQHLPAGPLFARLLLPTRIFGLAVGYLDSRSIPGDLYYTDAAPMVALVGLGLVGLWLAARRLRDAGDRGDELPVLGGLLALALLGLLLLAEPLELDLLLGPVSWRFVAFVRVGLALATLPLLARLDRWAPQPKVPVMVILGLAALSSCWWWSRPLAREVAPADGAEMREVRALWSGLTRLRGPGWGRVYLQDTLLTPPFSRRLGMSHVLALTARQTGVRQLGAAYSVTPFPTARWTASEMGNLYGRPLRGRRQLRRLLWMMERTNATHLVISDPFLARKLDQVAPFSRLLRVGRFTLYARRGASTWASALSAHLTITGADHRPGRIRVTLHNPRKGGRLLVKTAAAPAWQLVGPVGVRLATTRDGLMEVRGLPVGIHAVTLTYEPEVWPWLISLAAWLVIVGVALIRRRK